MIFPIKLIITLFLANNAGITEEKLFHSDVEVELVFEAEVVTDLVQIFSTALATTQASETIKNVKRIT